MSCTEDLQRVMVDLCTSYIPGGSNALYQYECTSADEWTELSSCPYHDSGLAIIDGELTTVGERVGLMSHVRWSHN